MKYLMVLLGAVLALALGVSCVSCQKKAVSPAVSPAVTPAVKAQEVPAKPVEAVKVPEAPAKPAEAPVTK